MSKMNSVVTIFLLAITGVSSLVVHTDPLTVLQPSKTSVQVRCYSNPSSNVKIVWKYGGKQIPLLPMTGRGTEETYVMSNNSLYIKELRKRNTGEYTCIASSGAQRIQAKTTVRVAYLQQFTAIPEVKAFQNSPEARIECVAPRGVPKPEVRWMKDGRDLNNSTEELTDGRHGRTLIVRNVKLSDAGAYTCFAKNRFKERNVTTNLQVVIPGDVTVGPKADVSIKEEQNAAFMCESTSKPPLPVQWRRLVGKCQPPPQPCKLNEREVVENERVKVVGGKLTFTNALPEDKGRYKCLAGLNSEFLSKNVTLNVVELMKIDTKLHQPVQRKDIRKSKDAKITCQFRGDGTLDRVTWAKKNTKRLPSNMVPDGQSLRITDLKISDAGNYTCTAVGEFNMNTGNVRLEVYESPVFVLRPSNVSGLVGEPAWVNCQGDGTPVPSVNYLKKDKQHSMLNETRFKKLTNHTLYISSLQKSDDGQYFCWLTQQYATDISEFYLSVREAPKKTDSGTPMARTVGIAVGCAGVYILLVIGLMIYCRARRARLLKKGLITEAEDGECLKDPLVGNEDIPLQNGKCLDHWEFPREDLKDHVLLGRGKMGRIFRAAVAGEYNDSRGEVVVVKEFDGKIEDYKTDFHLEVEMFSQLSHENVVRLIGVTTDSHPYYIITDYSECGDLKQYVSTTTTDLTNAARLQMAYCIAAGMEYLIQLHYIHRDLACRNCIPYPNHNVKVSFLSICEDVYHSDYYLLNNIPVPLRWLSPEAIRSEAYSEKSDVWSFGVTVWEIWSQGATPYTEHKNDKVADAVCKDLRLGQPRGCPTSVYEVMQQCWLADVNQRPTFQQITDMLSEIKLP